MHYNFTEHHSGAFSCHEHVDLNNDCLPQGHRTPFWCIFLSVVKNSPAQMCRPQQGLHTSRSQNTTLVHFLVMSMSTSTRIAYLKFTERHSGAFSCHEMVDINRDGMLPQAMRYKNCAKLEGLCGRRHCLRGPAWGSGAR